MHVKKLLALVVLILLIPTRSFAGIVDYPMAFSTPEERAAIRAQEEAHLRAMCEKIKNVWAYFFGGTPSSCGPKDPPSGGTSSNDGPGGGRPTTEGPGGSGLTEPSTGPHNTITHNLDANAYAWWSSLSQSWQRADSATRGQIYSGVLTAAAAGTLGYYAFGDTAIALGARRVLAFAGPAGVLLAMTSSANADESLEYQLQRSSVDKFMLDYEYALNVLRTNSERERLLAFYLDLGNSLSSGR